jgi:predicted GNAT superfamily acetyltransferase
MASSDNYASKTSARRERISRKIQDYSHDSIRYFKSKYNDIVNVDEIVRIIKERGLKKKRKMWKNFARL